MAAWKRPRARGESSSAHTEPPPADCPPMVTFAGSPPKAAMLSRTHSSAAIWSSSPRLWGASGIHPKPSKPSR